MVVAARTSSCAGRRNRCSTRGWCTPFHYRMVIKTQRGGNLIGSHVVLDASSEGTGQWQRCDRPERPVIQASAVQEDTAYTPLLSAPTTNRQYNATHLSDDEVL